MPVNPYEPPKGMEVDAPGAGARQDATSFLIDMAVGITIVIGLVVVATMLR